MTNPAFKKRTYTTFTQDSNSQNAMRIHGMILDTFQKKTTITDECKKLCNRLLSGNYETPMDSLFQESYFETAMETVSSWNEARVIKKR